MAVENETLEVKQAARIAVYDDLLSAPRIVEIQPCDIASYIEQIAAKTYELAQQCGGTIPYTVIREVSENFIHAQFKEPTVSILDRGQTIRFADQGPGIENKDRAQLPGFTSATSDMKDYIRGVGSGLPIVKEYLKFSNGRLVIEDNIREGTVITITVGEGHPGTSPVIYQEKAVQPQTQATSLDERDMSVLVLAAEMGEIGPADMKDELDIPVATGYRILTRLEEGGLLQKVSSRKRALTDTGLKALEG